MKKIINNRKKKNILVDNTFAFHYIDSFSSYKKYNKEWKKDYDILFMIKCLLLYLRYVLNFFAVLISNVSVPMPKATMTISLTHNKTVTYSYLQLFDYLLFL